MPFFLIYFTHCTFVTIQNYQSLNRFIERNLFWGRLK